MLLLRWLLGAVAAAVDVATARGVLSLQLMLWMLWMLLLMLWMLLRLLLTLCAPFGGALLAQPTPTPTHAPTQKKKATAVLVPRPPAADAPSPVL